MTILIYSMSFIPILLITLTVHELGHLIMARLYQLKVSGFQIGVGRRILTRHTGNTTVNIDSHTRLLNPAVPRPKPGDTASVYVTQDDDGSYTAQAILVRNTQPKLSPRHWEPIRHHNARFMQITGKVRRMDDAQLILADMTWSVGIIPLMAGVHLPEDPGGNIKNVYNTAPWSQRLIITLAGPVANIVLMILATLVLAAFPITSVSRDILTVSRVTPGGPAHTAGVAQGDVLHRIDNALHPTPEQITEHIGEALERQKPVTLGITRGRLNLRIPVHPDPFTGTIGISIQRTPSTSQGYSLTPGAIAQRFTNLGQIYINSIGALATNMRGDENSAPLVSGPIMGAYETAQIVRFAGPKAFLIILATINLGVAILNLLPFPPLDGFRLVTETVQALRHGKPMDPAIERVMTMSGITIIWLTAVYLMVTDILNLLE